MLEDGVGEQLGVVIDLIEGTPLIIRG